MAEPWHILFTCETHNPSGKRRRWRRKIRGLFNGERITEWLTANLPPIFRGCEVKATTPLHSTTYLVNPDYPNSCHNLA